MMGSVIAMFFAAAIGTAGALPGPAHAGEPVAADEGLHIDINIPALRLTVYRDGAAYRSYRIAVGMPGAYTPTGEFTVSHAEWNPWWHPPQGREWTRGREVTPPGARNPMGKVKLFFTDLYFIHGTPESESIGSPASQGCVRMRNEDAIELARLIHEHAGSNMASSEIDALLRSWRPTRHARFRTPPTLTIRYDPVEVEGDHLVFHRDLYQRNRVHSEAAIQAVMAAGMDPATIDRHRLSDAISEARAEGDVRVPLASLARDGVRARR